MSTGKKGYCRIYEFQFSNKEEAEILLENLQKFSSDDGYITMGDIEELAGFERCSYDEKQKFLCDKVSRDAKIVEETVYSVIFPYDYKL